MKTSIIILALLFIANSSLIGQDIYDKLSRKLCKCYEKNEVVDFKNDKSCIESILLSNITDLLEYHELGSISEFNAEDFANTLLGRMAKDCKYLTKVYGDTLTKYNPKFTPDENPECTDFHKGDFFYVQMNPETKIGDTIYVTFTEEEYLERIKRGKTYSRLSIKWISDCEFKLTFIESNDPFKNSLSKKGDVYTYQIRKINSKSMIVQFIWDGPDFFMEYFRNE